MNIHELADQWQAVFDGADGLMHNLKWQAEKAEETHGRNSPQSMHLHQAYEDAKSARAKLGRVEAALVAYIELEAE
jgi:hypothetical protein